MHMAYIIAELLTNMMNALHRGLIGAPRCLSSISIVTSQSSLKMQAAHLPLLRTPPAPSSPNFHSFSTSTTLCYDQEILSDQIRTSSKSFVPKTYFIDLKEDGRGHRYVKITEKSNGKKSGKYTNSKKCCFHQPLLGWLGAKQMFAQVCLSTPVTRKHSARRFSMLPKEKTLTWCSVESNSQCLKRLIVFRLESKGMMESSQMFSLITRKLTK